MTPSSMETYHWIKKIPTALLKRDEIPLVGFPPPFPWDKLTKKLGELLEIKDLAITAKIPEWRTAEQLFSGMGDHLVPLHISVAPMGGTLCWVMGEQDLALLMSQVLIHQSVPLNIMDPEFEQGFYRFLALETINTIMHLDFDKTLSAHILTENTLPSEDALCVDVSISLEERSVWGRVILSEELRRGWKEKYVNRTLEVPISDKVDVTLHIEAGRVALTPNEWKHVQLGDFILLDSCTVDPEGSGRVKLTINRMPLFLGEIAEGGIQLLEYSEQHEGDSNMVQNNDDDEAVNENEIPDDDELDSEETKEEDSELEEEDTSEENDEEDSSEEDEEEEPTSNEDETTEDNEDSDESESEIEDLDEEFDEEFEEELATQEKWPPPPERRPKESTITKPQETDVELTEDVTPTSLSEVPLSIVVEIGRLQMSLNKLIALQPGNLLDLNIHPESGVDLVVNGKCIAKGELLLIGDSLGVRILDI